MESSSGTAATQTSQHTTPKPKPTSESRALDLHRRVFTQHARREAGLLTAKIRMISRMTRMGKDEDHGDGDRQHC